VITNFDYGTKIIIASVIAIVIAVIILVMFIISVLKEVEPAFIKEKTS